MWVTRVAVEGIGISRAFRRPLIQTKRGIVRHLPGETDIEVRKDSFHESGEEREVRGGEGIGSEEGGAGIRVKDFELQHALVMGWCGGICGGGIETHSCSPARKAWWERERKGDCISQIV